MLRIIFVLFDVLEQLILKEENVKEKNLVILTKTIY